MPAPPPASDRMFDNADSFAQSFDDAWRALAACQGDPTERLERALEHVREHPFMQSRPELARQVADFRIRLLGL
ncbi:MAG: hypothetical protein VKJ66_05575 [Synechococcus sp.]|nr:hypothetical protein [Synechococcus sp.]